ncbi:phage baseplate assembly protein [Herminiimonas arsenitoxidans]|uniref:phage baseplate assembly protein n=1 Tax=Herminiimonas arsenitoxidans TaxID=1809410 RepID=UPI000970654B|nr:hypothetical protein [Herminiimonas arsenitoxidans]
MNDRLDPVSVLIGGKAHQAWQGYRIDSDLMTPADAWSLTCAIDANAASPDNIYEGAEARIMLGSDLIMTGLVDDVDEPLNKTSRTMELSGRDRASFLLDCSAPIMSMQQATLKQVVTKAVAQLGIKDVVYQAKPASPQKKVQTEPGQSVWEWLQSACEVNQVWPWFSPDGKLIIGAPDYTTPPVAHLVMRFRPNAKGNNIQSLQRTRSIKDSYSEITVLGQSSGDGDAGQHNIKGVAKDDTMPVYRPKVVVDGNCDSDELATRRANKLMADGRLARERIAIKVEGHRVIKSDGGNPPWAPGMRVHILSEPHGINAVYFLTRRVFTLNKAGARGTDLYFVPDSVWLLNIPFVKASRRKDSGKKKGHYVDSK